MAYNNSLFDHWYLPAQNFSFTQVSVPVHNDYTSDSMETCLFLPSNSSGRKSNLENCGKNNYFYVHTGIYFPDNHQQLEANFSHLVKS